MAIDPQSPLRVDSVAKVAMREGPRRLIVSEGSKASLTFPFTHCGASGGSLFHSYTLGLRNASGYLGRCSGHELREASEVLSDGRQQELVLCAQRTS
jgi:hypothetical protein